MVPALLKASTESKMSKEDVKSKLIKAAKARGIKGKSLESLLATVKAESDFVSGREENHKYKDFSRAKSIFRNLRGLSKKQFKELQKDRKKFFNKVYSNRKDIGTGPEEGFKARGIGLIQLTGSTKKKYAPEGYDDPSKFKNIDYDIKTTLDYYQNEVMGKADNIEDVTNIVNPNLPKTEKQKRLNKVVAKKQIKKQAEYKITEEQLKKAKEKTKGKSYREVAAEVSKFIE